VIPLGYVWNSTPGVLERLEFCSSSVPVVGDRELGGLVGAASVVGLADCFAPRRRRPSRFWGGNALWRCGLVTRAGAGLSSGPLTVMPCRCVGRDDPCVHWSELDLIDFLDHAGLHVPTVVVTDDGRPLGSRRDWLLAAQVLRGIHDLTRGYAQSSRRMWLLRSVWCSLISQMLLWRSCMVIPDSVQLRAERLSHDWEVVNGWSLERRYAQRRLAH